jgi:uncharacterized RDD family membrane protein YckC
MTNDVEYAGFWVRVGAAIIDTVLLALVILPVLTALYGPGYWSGDRPVQGPLDVLVSWVAPAIAVVVFWIARQATPGKMAIGARIVDAKTGGKPTTRQIILRFVGYYVAMLPLFLGILWVAFDSRKQGWHDKIAGTVVVRKKRATAAPAAPR